MNEHFKLTGWPLLTTLAITSALLTGVTANADATTSNNQSATAAPSTTLQSDNQSSANDNETNNSNASQAVQPAADSTDQQNGVVTRNGHQYYLVNGQEQKNYFYKDNTGKMSYYGQDGVRYISQEYDNWGRVYYFGADGYRVDNQMATIANGQHQGKTYYFGNDGAALTKHFYQQNGKMYYFGANGQRYENRFYQNWGHTYYFGADGVRYTNQWYSNWGHKYYFGDYGIRVNGTGYDGPHLAYKTINGNVYAFDRDGVMYTGLLKSWGHNYYFGLNGARYTNKWYSNWGHKYYFGDGGVLVTNQTRTMENAVIHFDRDGIATVVRMLPQTKKTVYGVVNPAKGMTSAPAGYALPGWGTVDLIHPELTNMTYGGYININRQDFYVGQRGANAATVYSMDQLPLDFKPGLLIYDGDHDNSPVVKNGILSDSQKQELSELILKWLNGFRQYAYNHYRDVYNRSFKDSDVAPADLKMTDAMQKGANAVAKYREDNHYAQDSHTINNSQPTFANTVNQYIGAGSYQQISTGTKLNQILGVPSNLAVGLSSEGENLAPVMPDRPTLLCFAVNIYNQMQDMLYSELATANQNTQMGGHAYNALNPATQVVGISFQKLDHSSTNLPAYDVVFETSGITGIKPDGTYDQQAINSALNKPEVFNQLFGSPVNYNQLTDQINTAQTVAHQHVEYV